MPPPSFRHRKQLTSTSGPTLIESCGKRTAYWPSASTPLTTFAIRGVQILWSNDGNELDEVFKDRIQVPAGCLNAWSRHDALRAARLLHADHAAVPSVASRAGLRQ